AVLAEEPAGDVHLVDALVAEVAATGVPDPVPVIVEPLATEGRHRGGTAPEIIIHFRRRGLRGVHLPDAGPPFVTEASRDFDFAQVARADPFNRFFDGEAGTALRAGLHDPAVLAGGFHHLASLPDVLGNRLFHVTNVFAGQSAHAADVVLAAPAESDNGDANGFVGAANTGPGISGQAEGGGGESGAFQEGSAIHRFHNYQWISPAVVVVAFN